MGEKLTLILECGGKGSGLLGLLSGSKGSGRAEDGSEAGNSLHLFWILLLDRGDSAAGIPIEVGKMTSGNVARRQIQISHFKP